MVLRMALPSTMGAMIARVIAPAWLVLPPVRTPKCSSQPWIDGSYEASMYCSPRSDAGRKMESCIHWEQLVRRISVLPSLRIMTGAWKLQDRRSTSESYFYAIRVRCKE